MKIRAASADDAPELAKLLTELGYAASVAEIERRLPSLLASKHDLALVYVNHADRAIGYLHALARYTLQHDPDVEIIALVVDSEHRGAGYGRALVARAEQWACELGIREVRVRSNVIRERTHGFYLSAGYALTKTSHLFERKL